MKIGVRKPNLKKSVKARTTGKIKRQVKKAVLPGYGKKGMGWVKDPKKAAYNKVYNKVTVDPLKSVKSPSSNKQTNKKVLPDPINDEYKSSEPKIIQKSGNIKWKIVSVFFALATIGSLLGLSDSTSILEGILYTLGFGFITYFSWNKSKPTTVLNLSPEEIEYMSSLNEDEMLEYIDSLDKGDVVIDEEEIL